MNQISAPAQLGLGPIFRRVTHAATSEPATPDSPVRPTDVIRDQQLSSSAQQPVESSTIQHVLPQTESVPTGSRLIIAVDFGTAYSTVSYVKVDAGVDTTTIGISNIRCIDNYDSAHGNSDARASSRADNVPTKLLYLGKRAADAECSDCDENSEEENSQDDYISLMSTQPTTNPHQSFNGQRKRGRRLRVSSPRRKMKPAWSRAAGISVHWGFVVEATQKEPHELVQYEQKEAVELIKLTLAHATGEDEELRSKVQSLRDQIDRLHSSGMVDDRDHLLCDYLARLLRHSRSMLLEQGLLDNTQLEYVMCVPVSWSQNACRNMHNAMVMAVQNSGLDVLAQNLIPDLFIVSEPEAAAQFVIASLGSKGRLRQDEVFIILDAGGGTVDITTYAVTSNRTGPLRLRCEMIPPDGALCGSTLITQRYLRKMKVKLNALAPHDEDPGLLEGVAIALANKWDIADKPSIDVAHKKDMRLGIGGRSWYNGKLIKWTPDEIREVFEPSLKGTIDLLERQLQLARANNLIVSKLIVVGGFGESPSLRSRIRRFLSASSHDSGEQIEVIWPNDFPTSAVARGAVLRALDKRNGPSRISRSSFGFLRHERYGEMREHEEAGAAKERDDTDNDDYVRNTICWMIQAGQHLDSHFETAPIVSYHAFHPLETKLRCVEKLYVSQFNHRSHFKFNHQQNQGAELLSDIEIDLSDFKRDFPLELKANLNERLKVKNQKIRVVKFDLVVGVEGKQLKFEARWPPGARTPGEVRMRKSGYVSLAPSFAPGVA